MLLNKRFDRQAPCGRRSDNRQIADTAHGHIQRARNRRRGQGQNIDFSAQRFEFLFLRYPKAVLAADAAAKRWASQTDWAVVFKEKGAMR